jgi:hypothetical protein
MAPEFAPAAAVVQDLALPAGQRRRYRAAAAVPLSLDGDCRGATMADLSRVPHDRLEDMAAAGEEILECYRLLRKTGDNVVADILRGQGDFFEWDHYPRGDVYDAETRAQYYYHAHAADRVDREHGHFHTFLRPAGPSAAAADGGLVHLIAIAMDGHGSPFRLFTTNRWVTGETWRPADAVIGLLDGFVIDQAYPSLAVNIWIAAMIRLYRPEIEELLWARDRVIAAWRPADPTVDALEDRALEVASSFDVAVDEQIDRVKMALHRA